MRKEAIQYITATLAAFGPDEAISMTKETWSKLREAMKALAEQPAQQRTEELLEIFKDVDQCGPLLGMGQPAQQCKWPTCQSEKYQQALAEQIKRELVGEQPAQQEPVAWIYQCSANNSGPVLMQHKQDWAKSGSGFWTEEPLYTSPPAQRTWVGLTDEELRQVWYDDAPVEGGTYIDKLRQVEAKLKEKNT